MSNETEEIIVVRHETIVDEGEGEILDIVDIEEYILSGRPVPRARIYRFRVNKQLCQSHTPELTGTQILEKAGLLPTSSYRLRLKRPDQPPEEIKPDEEVHLRKHRIERFIAQKKEVQDGLELRRQFSLLAEDAAFLAALGLQWETLRQGNRLWIIIYGLPLPPVFQVDKADVAIEIAAGYPTAQLDMAYFSPALQRVDGRAIARVECVEQIDGKNFQRWSRHRTGAAVWTPGLDNLETHFAYVQGWLTRETEQ